MSLQKDIKQYKTIVFDCDGVILDSNITKIDAYFRTAKKLGATDMQAQVLVDHHVKFGGISRYSKFEWYLKEILKQTATEEAIKKYLDAFGIAVKKGLMGCRVAEGLHALRKQTSNANWLVVSGGDQQEIRDLFATRSLANLFDGGIFGSPDNKDEILMREMENGNIQMPALFLGDSKYDYESSTRAGLDFIFLSAWTDVLDWKTYCEKHQIHVYKSLKVL